MRDKTASDSWQVKEVKWKQEESQTNHIVFWFPLGLNLMFLDIVAFSSDSLHLHTSHPALDQTLMLAFLFLSQLYSFFPF